MSMELLRLTSASLPSSATPHINKPVVPNVGTLNSSIFSPLPQSTDDNCGSWDQKMTENQRPTSSPITIKARDASIDLFSASAQSSLVSSPSRDSRSIQSSLLTCTNTSTPGSVRVKISPNKLMEIPSPIPNKTKSSDGTAVQTPPRALGIPTNRPDKESNLVLIVSYNLVEKCNFYFRWWWVSGEAKYNWKFGEYFMSCLTVSF